MILIDFEYFSVSDFKIELFQNDSSKFGVRIFNQDSKADLICKIFPNYEQAENFYKEQTKELKKQEEEL